MLTMIEMYKEIPIRIEEFISVYPDIKYYYKEKGVSLKITSKSTVYIATVYHGNYGICLGLNIKDVLADGKKLINDHIDRDTGD